MKLFSKTPFPALFFISIFYLLVSCDKDEEPTKPDNHIIFNGKKYSINTARLKYVDEADLRYHDADIGVTHYQHSMRFSDGTIDPANDFYIQNGKFKLTFSVFRTMQDHSREFNGGTFSPVHPQDFFGSKAPLDKSFYTFFILRVDDNGNGVFDQGETWYDGLEGEITITGSGENFNVIINTSDTAHNTSTNGSYEGNFEVTD
jgi:hypothetical protein